MATAQPVHDRLRDTVSRLVHRGLGVEDYWRAVSDALDGAVPSEGSCLMTMDPATMLPTAEFVENGMPADAISRLVEIELREPDYTKWVDMEVRRPGVTPTNSESSCPAAPARGARSPCSHHDHFRW